MAVLHPFAKLPEPRTATVLLVGAVGPGQSALAEAMCRINSPFSINVHIASKLPLPGHNEHRRPRIDLILLLIDLTSINSLRVVEDSLRLLSASFFIGRVFFAITKDRPASELAVGLDVVQKLAEGHHSGLLHVNLQTERGVLAAARRVVRLLVVCAGLCPGLSATRLSALTCPGPAQQQQQPQQAQQAQDSEAHSGSFVTASSSA
ncbi:centromere protein M [Lampetra fluviatilis]